MANSLLSEGYPSFPGLASFYRKFINDFSSITAPITDCLKKGNFSGVKQQDSFDCIKRKRPILKLPDFSAPFEVVVDACGSGMVVFCLNKATQLNTSVRNLVAQDKHGVLMNKSYMLLLGPLNSGRIIIFPRSSSS